MQLMVEAHVLLLILARNPIIMLYNSYISCRCNSGYALPDCNATCTPNCPLNSRCVTPNVCNCDPGYQGQYCNITFTCANVQNCNSHGDCVAQDTCNCYNGK